VAKEVADLNLPNVHITKFLKDYTF